MIFSSVGDRINRLAFLPYECPISLGYSKIHKYSISIAGSIPPPMLLSLSVRLATQEPVHDTKLVDLASYQKPKCDHNSLT